MTMTREQFQGHVMCVFSSALTWKGDNEIYWNHGSPDHYEVEWVTGGATGGNCWGDTADRSVSAEPEPELELLDQLLEEVAPNLTVKQYKQILSEVVTTSSRSAYEYYGNYTDYGVKKVYFDALYRTLCEAGVI